MRESRVSGGVAAHAHSLGCAVVAGLDVEHPAGPASAGIGNGCSGEAGPGDRRVLPRLNLELSEIDADTEVDIDLAYGITEIFELAIRIPARIDHHHESAHPPHHLVQPEVVEVAAARPVNPSTAAPGF